MKTTLFIFVLMALPWTLLGSVPPSVYENAQKHSSDVLMIKVGKVTRYRYSRNRVYIKARVRVLTVARSTHRIDRGSWITIRYKTRLHLPHGMMGAAPVPILKRGHTYRAYLKRSRHSRYYVPAAGFRSFVNKH